MYFENLVNNENIEIIACADLDFNKARLSANQFGIARACKVEEILSDTEIRLILNLTVPQAHAQVSLAAIESGKHLYSEKPLAIEKSDGYSILKAAARTGVMVGCAPDTFLGAGIQTSRMLLDEQVIGNPIAASAQFTSRGHEHWHPNPGFFYLRGGGPVFDMGPYYITALVVLLGPIIQVSSIAKRTRKERTSAIHPNKKFPVEVPTHVVGSLLFENGDTSSITMSFDLESERTQRLEIFGEHGTIRVPDPNTFGGPVMIKKTYDQWVEEPLRLLEGGRGLGVLEMASALREKRISRIDANLANHVLEVMHSLHDSSDLGKHITIQSSCPRPDPISTQGNRQTPS